MSAIQLVRGRHDVEFADALRADLALRQWSVELAAFTMGEVGPSGAEQKTVAMVPHAPGPEFDACLAWLAAAFDRGETPILIVPEDTELPANIHSAAGAIVFRDSLDYDQIFEDLYRKLAGTLPSWLDVRVRPTLVQSPTGVAWWADDLFVADDRFDHVVRISPNDSTVVVPGLYEPHHVSMYRRQLVIANRSADEIVECAIVDNMASDVQTKHEIDGHALSRPHDVQMDARMSVVADTDNSRVLFRHGADGDWREVKPDVPLHHPGAVCLDDSGFWVADTFNHRVLKFDHDGRQIYGIGWDGNGDEGDAPASPVGVLRWRDLLFVADESNERVEVLQVIEEEDGSTWLRPRSNQLGASTIGQPFGLSVNRNNRLAVTDRKQKCIWLVDLVELLQVEPGLGDAQR